MADTPSAAQFETPEIQAQYSGLLRDAVSAEGDVVESVRSQVRDSIQSAHTLVSNQVSAIHGGIRQSVAEGTATAGSAANQIRQSIHDQVQARIAQAGSTVAVIGQQVQQQFCYYIGCGFDPDNPDVHGSIPEVVNGPCGLSVGDIIAPPGASVNYTVLAGPYPDMFTAAQSLPGLTCAPTATQPGQWWVCCCGQQVNNTTPPPPNCSWDYEAHLDWDGNTDYDLYTYGPNGMCYWEKRTAAPLTLNDDAHPDCNPTPNPEETIKGTFNGPSTLRVFYNNYKPDCGTNIPPKTAYWKIINNSSTDIQVNGTTVTGGNNITGQIPVDPSPGNQATYTGGLTLAVTCPVSSGGGVSGTLPPPPLSSHLVASANGGCNIAQVVQSPSPGTLCIGGPFPDETTAQQWLAAAIASGQAQMLCAGTPTQTPPNCPACPVCHQCGNGPCNCPPPVVNCPAPVVNVNVSGGTTNTYNQQQYVSNVTNITNIVNNIQNTVNEYIRNIRETVNNITNRNVYNQQRTVNNTTDTFETTINRYLGDVANYIDSLNTITNVNGGGGGSAGRSFILKSDASWESEIDPSTDPEIQSIVDRVRQDAIAEWQESEATDFADTFQSTTDVSSDNPYVRLQ